MRRTIPLLAALLVATSLAAPAGAAAATSQSQVTLTVSVTTPEDEPVGNAELTATWADGSRTATTASNGKAFVDVPEGANVSISVNHSDYVRNFPVNITDASERQVEITVHPVARASITVADENRPVQGARVRFIKAGQPAISRTTGANGVAESGRIEAGEYRVTVFKRTYFREETRLTIRNSVEKRITLEQGTRTLTVNVSDDHFSPPRPVPQARIQVPGIGNVRTAANGIAQISVPVNSRFRISVTKDAYENASRAVTVFERDTRVNVTIRRTPKLTIERQNERVVVGETLRVTVRDEYGDPVSDAEILLDGEAVATTNREGVATVSVESQGRHTVQASVGRLTSAEKPVIGIEARTDTESPSPTPSPTPSPSPSPTPGDTGIGSPGFGAVGAVLAVLLAILAVARRRA